MEVIAMSIQKKFNVKHGVCRVVFTLPKTVVDHAQQVAVVGDFNNWQQDKNLMKKNKSGTFQCSLDLPIGKDYQFRYLIDKYTWESDWDADALAETPYEETYNSVIHCSEP